ncbi:hypothetical protein TraAM80_01860 [Trypanosoma rangeli]|uniref:Uncharacterized protein n=1 Tax=Trypanosoma rangeli TaxID=5698 RepID=A0A422NXF3_TRYRA|nr:uncharacterized protein TraAM80_01860 [Trypanosoma rangeli]RNF10111.1 hypothetical protein TraAM80_01860 [Trypanosoma rangeli]|eukprot:RNF10111.1 hypothetical protein TraAM80_01860 [Trypanosoma rangeli]
MSWWGPLTKQMLLRLSRHPAVSMYARQGMNYVRSHPSSMKMTTAMSNSWGELRNLVRSSASAFNKSGFDGSTMKGGYTAQVFGMWNKYKGRVFSFIAVNFMGLLFLFQFGSVLWSESKQFVARLLTEPEKKIRKSEGAPRAIKVYVDAAAEEVEGKEKHLALHHHEKQKKEERHPDKSESLERFSFVFSDGTDAYARESMQRLERDVFGDVAKPDFSTSFKFRMSEDEEFRSAVKK